MFAFSSFTFERFEEKKKRRRRRSRLHLHVSNSHRYRGSPRRALIASTIGGGVVATAMVYAFQISLPSKYSAYCMENGELLPCCSWDEPGSSRCNIRSRDPQGMSSAFDSMLNFPFLFLNGVSAIIYCLANVLILRHSAGQILKVNASLFATILIAPLLWIIVPYERDFTPAISFFAVFVAITGATLSTATPVQIKNVLYGCLCEEDHQNKDSNDEFERSSLIPEVSSERQLQRPKLNRNISSSSTMSTIVRVRDHLTTLTRIPLKHSTRHAQ